MYVNSGYLISQERFSEGLAVYVDMNISNKLNESLVKRIWTFGKIVLI